MTGQGKFWCFTIFPDPESGEDLKPGEWDSPPAYCVWQYEAASSTDRYHIQGYCCFFTNMRFNTLKAMLPDGTHIEKREGTHAQAKAYCMKEDTRMNGPYEYGSDIGIANGQGARSDLKRARDFLLVKTNSMKDFSLEHPGVYFKYAKNCLSFRVLHSAKRNWEMEVITLVGPTGVGKTRYVYDTYPLEEIYSLPPPKGSGTYWDGYDGQRIVLIDEMYGNRFSHGCLLQLLDRYPFQVPVHGGTIEFVSKIIVMTSNAHPKEWYSSDKFTYEEGPLQRRLTQHNSRVVTMFMVPGVVASGDAPPVIPLNTRSVSSHFRPVDDSWDNNNNV